MRCIESIEELESKYGDVVPIARYKEINYINEHYRKFIEASPFIVLATKGAQGIDCSPRGDPPGFVRVVDEKTLLIPDRRGNNRIDSLRNIVSNGEAGLIFLIPNVGEAMRVTGKASVVLDEKLQETFSINGKMPTSLIRVEVEKAYYQCQKAIARSKLWSPESHIDRGLLPTAGEMAQSFSKQHGEEFDGAAYDKAYPERMRKVIY
ncbi:MAG: pyridoxamine 5'-phosphate oxidase family protein [Symploca sp. SIO2D2]|nr:pyridoxamine 5'-phosphate oxidase family protein [Symploca sp. SIO2D2]